jgi:hypothetical protein
MENPFGPVKYERTPKGAFVVEGVELAHTLQCCHCGNHFVSIKGSGKTRGFCLNCSGITCGGPGCDVCVPFEKRLELHEKGKILLSDWKKYPMR